MADILEKTAAFADVNDPIVMAKLETLELLPLPCLITTFDHSVVWYNRSFLKTYASALPDINADLVSFMMGCAVAAKTNTAEYTNYCSDCPIRSVYLQLDAGHEIAHQRGTMTIPVPWGRHEIDIELTGSRIALGQACFVLFTMEDISSEVDRYKLNRVFYHDLLNIVQQMYSTINLAKMIIDDSKKEGYRIPTQLKTELSDFDRDISTIVSLVNAQRQLNNAQNSTLIPAVSEFSPMELLQDLIQAVHRLDDHGGRYMAIVPSEPDIVCDGDSLLIKQVCYGLIINLIFSSRAEQIIEMGYDVKDSSLVFWFRNREAVLKDSKLAQFRAEYSLRRTRSIHSYTIELLAAKYLKGEVAISSGESEGTVLSLTIPGNPRRAAAPQQ